MRKCAEQQGNKLKTGEKRKDEGVRGGGRSAEMWNWAEEEEEGGRDEPPVLSCQCFLCRWGRRSAKSLYPTHTDTHALLYNGCFTLVPEREGLRQKGDMVRRRNREMKQGGYTEKERNRYDIQKRELRKMLGRCCGPRWCSIAGKWREASKSLDQSREETDETVWEQYEAAIGLIDLSPERIKGWHISASSTPRSLFHCRCQLGGVWMCLWQRFIRNDS